MDINDTIIPENENNEQDVLEALSAVTQEPAAPAEQAETPKDNPFFRPAEPGVERVERVERVHTTYVPPVPPAAPVPPATPVVPAPAPAPEEEKKPEKKSGGKSWWKILIAAVIVAAMVVGSCATMAVIFQKYWDNRIGDYEEQIANLEEEIDGLETKIKNMQKNNSGTNNNTGESVSGTPVPVEGLTPGQVYARNVNAVVLITAESTVSGYGQSGTSISNGSGFIISEDGYVVTNCHVAEGADKLTVQTADGDTYTAELVGSDSANDVAVLKVEAEGLQAVTKGSSDDLIVGDQVVAIGNPLGELTSTLTVGYVSAKERDVNTDGTVINMIQTDAAINSGNSGGPLFNMKGEVVGITTAKYSGTSNSGATIEGIGFAIPIDDVYDMIDDWMSYGYITGAYLGISVGDTDPDAAAYFDVPTGAYVYEVMEGYCAEKAGIKAKDVIVKLGDHDISGLNDLSRALRSFEAGETTTVVVIRSGQELELTITLDERPQEVPEATVPDENANEDMPSSGSFEEWFEYFFGIG